MSATCTERHGGGERPEGLVLRRSGDGGLAEVPYVVVLLADDGGRLPVPAHETDHHDDGSVTARGRAHGFAAQLRLAAPEGDGRRAELTVRRTAETSVRAGLRAELRLGALESAESGESGESAGPGWLVPGVFYGQNRLPGCTRPYPRYEAGVCDVASMTSDAWSFRADRCATPAVFARDGAGGAALVLAAECGTLGENGVGFALLPGGRPALRLHAPYREEPLSYYGSSEPRPAETPAHLWRPGEVHTLTFTLYLLDADPHAYAPVLRAHRERGATADAAVPDDEVPGPAAWVGLDEAAELAAYGLHRWHYRAVPSPASGGETPAASGGETPSTSGGEAPGASGGEARGVLLETAAFDREALGESGDRQAMHVSWISGVPYAHALLLHARRTGDAEKAAAARAVLDNIAGNLTPGGTFWGQWTRQQGWNVGWHPDRRRLHSRTLGDAALFLLRALVAERAHGTDHPGWERAVRSSLAAAVAGQDAATGRLPAALDSGTGEAVDHEGGAGLSWIAPLVEAAGVFGEPALLEAARRAGAHHAADVRAEFLCGAPEDVSLAPTSEDGYNALIAYTLLHEADPDDPRWLDLARRAADWTLTFRYTYDVHFAEDTLLGRYGFRTRGADQASPSNQHLHAFGLICLPETVRLARHLDDPYYLRSARENLDCFRQFVARRDGDFNAYRGMVSERFYQTECFQAKGMLLTLSHAWSAGVLLYACEAALGLPEFQEQEQEQEQERMDEETQTAAGEEELCFPEGFRWGTATSAYQVEGSTKADGRGESIWDRFCAVPGAVENGDTGDVACDMYRRATDDIGLMARLGTNAHRFSLAWPRILPEGTGRVEPRGLAHYDRFVDALLEHGISPLVTLYHWDLPQPLQERGGWRARETAEAFAEYAAVCFDAFGDRVQDWVTVNEPWIAGLLGHQLGLHAPGERDLAGSVRAMHHLLLAHGLAAPQAAGTARTGIAHALFPHTPADPASAADRAAAHASDGYVNRWFLDAVHGRGYPEDMRRHWEQAAGELDFVHDGDMAAIGARSDFIGVNYYTRRIVSARGAHGAGRENDGPWPWKVEPGRDGVPQTDLGWEIVPDELAGLLVRLHQDYPGVPLMITENGGIFDDGPGADGGVHDERRIGFLRGHLGAVHRALEAGAPVEGYYHWSLIDNFEWAMGYRPRFGLVHLDRETQRRTVKDSGHWYAGVARSGRLGLRG